ncbi:hypothetical protein [Oceanobacillus sp. J11TS1]|uniref:hypothetical protein n=1 Tax=Oceanobacillus sp. J11TS1 TaxID=2807191 RepID=UPI001B2E4BD1|nr:hypothetical protein [Oceanobacillus sp. J11TS1]GIO24325.1 hypothetical protein J11TS1_29060 [Oceanobacillus sp. J11TS1]
MSKRAFHIYNIIILLFLLSFNFLVLFGAGVGEGGISSGIWFITGMSLGFWLIFYIIQFVRSNKVWRISWFLIMIVFLWFWETGLGSVIGSSLFNMG